jgi:hypothetical protein
VNVIGEHTKRRGFSRAVLLGSRDCIAASVLCEHASIALG